MAFEFGSPEEERRREVREQRGGGGGGGGRQGRGSRGGGRGGKPQGPSQHEKDLWPLESPVNFVDGENPVVVKVKIEAGGTPRRPGGEGLRMQRQAHPQQQPQQQQQPRSSSLGGGAQGRRQSGGGNPRGGKGRQGGGGGGGGGEGGANNSNDRGSVGKRRRRLFDDYMDEQEALSLLAGGLAFKGRVRLNPFNHRAAYVTPEHNSLGMDILLDGHRHRNRAFEGDTVVVTLLPVDQWGQRGGQDSTHKTQATVADALQGLKLDDDGGEEEDLEGEESGPDEEDEEGPGRGNTELGVPTSLVLEGEGELLEDEDAILATSLHPSLTPQETALWRPRAPLGPPAALPSPSSPSSGPPVHPSVVSMLEQGKGLQPAGTVVLILENNHRMEYVGRLRPRTPLDSVDSPLSGKDAFVDFVPSDHNAPRMLVPRSECPWSFVQRPSDFLDKLWIVRLKKGRKWAVDCDRPLGEDATCVGQAGEIVSETAALLMSYGVDHGDFPPPVLQDLQDMGGVVGGSGQHSVTSSWAIPTHEYTARRDFRAQRIMSIDPLTAKDLDDALHATRLDDGTIEIGVHIADVSWFVREGSALDLEARRRATTVYLIQKTVPMLPPLLCEQLCSLNPGVERLSFSVVWRMHEDGTMVDEAPWYGRSVIKSCAKLDYATAQQLIDHHGTQDEGGVRESLRWSSLLKDGHSLDEAVKDLRLLHSVAMNRRVRRFSEGGALSLNRCKLFFTLDDDGNPTGFRDYPLHDTNRMVEEYMLLANFLVAQKLIQGVCGLSMLRRHPPPAAKAMEAFLESTAKAGFDLGTHSDAGALQQALDTLQTQGIHPDVVRGIIALATHPMRPAEYLAAGQGKGEGGWRHYALNIPYYTHFTSPIRRYADVMVHRQLALILAQESPLPPSEEQAVVKAGVHASVFTMQESGVHEVAKHCNEKRLAAKNAQDGSSRLYLCLTLKHHGAVCSSGVVIGLGPQSFTLFVPLLDLERRMQAQALRAKPTWDTHNKVLTLSPTADAHGAPAWGAVDMVLHLFDRVMVKCFLSNNGGAMAVDVEITQHCGGARGQG